MGNACLGGCFLYFSSRGKPCLGDLCCLRICAACLLNGGFPITYITFFLSLYCVYEDSNDLCHSFVICQSTWRVCVKRNVLTGAVFTAVQAKAADTSF